MSSAAKVDETPMRNGETTSSRTHRPQMLDPRTSATEARSYRSMSPSRFLDYPLAVNPAIYTYTRVRRERDRTKEREKAREKREKQKEATEENQEMEDIDDDLELDKPKPTQPGFHPSSTPYESIPGKERIDYYLDAIAQLYYRKKTPATSAITPAMAHQELDLFPYPTLHTLMSPLRTPHPVDKWTARELLLFEAAITGAGKDFHTIRRIVGSKSHTEVIDMYYVWKKTAHYALWKHFGRQSRLFHPFRLECWSMAEEKMRGMTDRTPIYASPDAKPIWDTTDPLPPVQATSFELNALQLALGGPTARSPRYRRLLSLLRMTAAGKIMLGIHNPGNSRINQTLSRSRKLRLLRAVASGEVLLARERERAAAERLKGNNGSSNGEEKEGNSVGDKWVNVDKILGPDTDKDAKYARVQAQRREAHLRAAAERMSLSVLADLEQERARQYHLALGACEEVAAAVGDVFNDRETAHEVARNAASTALMKLGLSPATHARVTDVVASLALRRVWHARVQTESSALELAARDIMTAQRSRERVEKDGAVGMVTRGASGARKPKRGAATLFETEELLPASKRRRG